MDRHLLVKKCYEEILSWILLKILVIWKRPVRPYEERRLNAEEWPINPLPIYSSCSVTTGESLIGLHLIQVLDDHQRKMATYKERVKPT